MTRARGAIAGLGQAGAGKARSKDRAKRCSPRPRKPGLRLSPLRWKSPWGENRGGTPIDVRLPLLEVRPYPSGTAEYHLRLSAFRLRHFFVLSCSSLPGKRREAPSSTKSPGNPCGSHAYEALPPALCARHLSMDHRQRRPKDAGPARSRSRPPPSRRRRLNPFAIPPAGAPGHLNQSGAKDFLCWGSVCVRVCV